MNTITLTNLQVPTIIGVYDIEKKAPQTLSITLSFAIDIEKPASTDNLIDAVDYAKIRETILDFAKSAQFNLLETFVFSLANHIKNAHHLSWLKLSVTKQPIDMPDLSGVTLSIVLT